MVELLGPNIIKEVLSKNLQYLFFRVWKIEKVETVRMKFKMTNGIYIHNKLLAKDVRIKFNYKKNEIMLGIDRISDKYIEEIKSTKNKNSLHEIVIKGLTQLLLANYILKREYVVLTIVRINGKRGIIYRYWFKVNLKYQQNFVKYLLNHFF